MNAWLLTIMLAVAPPGRTPWRESEEAGRARYMEIAADIETVVAAEPPMFSGAHGRELTGLLVLAIAVHESGLRLDVDTGATRGGGKDVCLMQLRGFRPTDRRDCLREGLRLARKSFAACAGKPLRERLAAYASGSCTSGLVESRSMIDAWGRWSARWPAPGGSL